MPPTERDIQNETEQIMQTMLDALKTVLTHVEDDQVSRVGSQCTLCYTYRKIMRDAIRTADPDYDS
jgi:hypothetical protein